MPLRALAQAALPVLEMSASGGSLVLTSANIAAFAGKMIAITDTSPTTNFTVSFGSGVTPANLVSSPTLIGLMKMDDWSTWVRMMAPSGYWIGRRQWAAGISVGEAMVFQLDPSADRITLLSRANPWPNRKAHRTITVSAYNMEWHHDGAITRVNCDDSSGGFDCQINLPPPASLGYGLDSSWSGYGRVFSCEIERIAGNYAATGSAYTCSLFAPEGFSINGRAQSVGYPIELWGRYRVDFDNQIFTVNRIGTIEPRT